MGKGKSEWVCYGAERMGISGDAVLGKANLREVDEYKYLGIELHTGWFGHKNPCSFPLILAHLPKISYLGKFHILMEVPKVTGSH